LKKLYSKDWNHIVLTGKLVEHIPSKETDSLTMQLAMERLYEINNLKRELSKDVLEAIDETS